MRIQLKSKGFLKGVGVATTNNIIRTSYPLLLECTGEFAFVVVHASGKAACKEEIQADKDKEKDTCLCTHHLTIVKHIRRQTRCPRVSQARRCFFGPAGVGGAPKASAGATQPCQARALSAMSTTSSA